MIREFDNSKNPKYKEGEYILFKSRQPLLHINRMFGNTKESDIKEAEYKGAIKDILQTSFCIDYTVITVFPVEGFICSVLEEKILQTISFEEIEQEIESRKKKYAKMVDTYEKTFEIFS